MEDNPNKPADKRPEPVEITATEAITDEIDAGKTLPVEAARAHLRHWWREPVAGMISVAIGVYDSWAYGHEKGLSSSLDELLVIGGIILIAGSKRLFSGPPTSLDTDK